MTGNQTGSLSVSVYVVATDLPYLLYHADQTCQQGLLKVFFLFVMLSYVVYPSVASYNSHEQNSGGTPYSQSVNIRTVPFCIQPCILLGIKKEILNLNKVYCCYLFISWSIIYLLKNVNSKYSHINAQNIAETTQTTPRVFLAGNTRTVRFDSYIKVGYGSRLRKILCRGILFFLGKALNKAL